MKIFENIYTINGFPALYFKELDLIAISDLQLGEEMYLAEEKGIFVPQIQLEKEKNLIRKICEKVKASRILINGDLKHEFGEASKQEWREVIDFLDLVKRSFEEIIVVRGNHDNFLINILRKIGLEVFDPFYEENGYLFTHGHKLVKISKNVHTITIGHEEPSILIKSGFDRAKYKVIIFGKTRDKKKLICLPAFSFLSTGTDVNMIEQSDILSPILKNYIDLNELDVIALDEELGELYLGKIGDLKEKI
ncbi:MAG: metallophosphoesterase [Candidatus Aenigmatarchaeota archaeon]